MLARAGKDVWLIARGAHKNAIIRRGLALSVSNERYTVHAHCTDTPADVPPVDVLIIAVKAHQLPESAQTLMPLLGKDTMVVTIANGIPWWYGYGLHGALANVHLQSVDPSGVVWNALQPERAIGCVTNVGSAIVSPGQVHMANPSWFRMGEPTAPTSARLQQLVAVLTDVGIDAQPREDIRSDIWHKLWGNACYNPLSVLAGTSLGELSSDPRTIRLIRTLMEEIRPVAAACGVDSLRHIDKRIATARTLGGHKTSMLQDWEQGKALELGAIVGAVCELADILKVPTPTLSMLYGLMQHKQDKMLGQL